MRRKWDYEDILNVKTNHWILKWLYLICSKICLEKNGWAGWGPNISKTQKEYSYGCAPDNHSWWAFQVLGSSVLMDGPLCVGFISPLNNGNALLSVSLILKIFSVLLICWFWAKLERKQSSNNSTFSFSPMFKTSTVFVIRLSALIYH